MSCNILRKIAITTIISAIVPMASFAEEIPYFNDIHIVPFSSQTFEGVDELRSIIEDIASDDDDDDVDSQSEE